MNVLDRIENRVTLPGDGETDRSRKTLATAVLFASSLGLLINAVTMASNGVTISAWQYAIFALSALLGGVVVLAVPRSYGAVVRLFLLVSILFNVVGQVTFGGYSSGVYAMPWAILGPLGAVLFFGAGFALLSLGVFALALVAMAVLEPLAMTMGQPLDTAVLVGTNSSSLAILCLMVTLASLYLLRQVERYRLRANDLLLNIPPGSIAARLKQCPETIADGYNEVTVLFADIVDFTGMSSGADPVEVVNLLNDIFSKFDDLAQKYGLEKIKTIGDAYMVAAGLPVPRVDHTEAIARFAVEMLGAVEKHEGFHGEPVRLRVGINTGPVVAGVIGRQKFIYDLWGDAVNVASRMESNGLANQIQVTEAVKEKLDNRYDFVEREPIEVKGKGMMVTYLLEQKTENEKQKT
jgi:class 3 adenylate cyclase